MRVGFIGLGDRAAHLAKVFFRLIPDFEIVGYADPAPVTLPRFAEWGVPIGAAYADHRDLLRKERLDLVVVVSPNHLHLEHIKDSLEAGCRVFTEKPVVTTEAQTFALLELLRRYGRDSVMVGLVLRYAPLYRDIRAAIAAGQLGEIMSVEAAEHIAPEHGAFFMRDWRRDVAMSGGFMLEKCCHDLDLYQGLIGNRAKRVASFGGRRFFTAQHAKQEASGIYHSRKSRWGGTDSVFGSETQLVDNQVALIEYEDGTNLCFHTNLNVPDEYRRFTIVGTKGMAEGDFVRGYLQIHDAESGQLVARHDYSFDCDALSMHYGAEEGMAADLTAHFYQGKPLPVSILDGMAAGLTAIKIDEAMQSGHVLDLAPVWDRFDSFGL